MKITVRPLSSSDGIALTSVIEASPDTGFVTLVPRFHQDAYTVYARKWLRFGGVVAVAPHDERIVGAALYGLQKVRFRAQVLPAAYLFSLVVHPEWRRQGIGRWLVCECVTSARKEIGRSGILYAHIQRNNVGSLRIFEKECDCLVGCVIGAAASMQERLKNRLRRVSVREAKDEDLHAIHGRLNAFYADYDLWPPETEESLRTWLKDPLHQHYLVTDDDGRILGGMSVSNEPVLHDLEIVRLPPAMKLINRLVNLVPPDNILRPLLVDRVWFEPGYLSVARELWETLRWKLRDMGNSLAVSYDQRDKSLREIFHLPRWLPRVQTTVALWYPDDISYVREAIPTRARLLYSRLL